MQRPLLLPLAWFFSPVSQRASEMQSALYGLSSAVSYPTFSPFTKTRRVSGRLPNGRSSGRRKDRRTIQNKNAKRRAHRFNGAPALFSFMGSVSFSLGLSAWKSVLSSPHCGNGYLHIGQRKPIIRTHLQPETGSDYIGLVLQRGLEPRTPCLKGRCSTS